MYDDRWLTAGGGEIEPKTLSSYRQLLTLHVLPMLGSLKVPEIRQRHVKGLLMSKRAGRLERAKGKAPRQTAKTSGYAKNTVPLIKAPHGRHRRWLPGDDAPWPQREQAQVTARGSSRVGLASFVILLFALFSDERSAHEGSRGRWRSSHRYADADVEAARQRRSPRFPRHHTPSGERSRRSSYPGPLHAASTEARGSAQVRCHSETSRY
jgi:hypothetical protein